MLGDDVVEGVCLDVVLDPDDVAIGSDCDQAARECVIASQCLGIDDGAIVEVDHGGESGGQRSSWGGFITRILFVPRVDMPVTMVNGKNGAGSVLYRAESWGSESDPKTL